MMQNIPWMISLHGGHSRQYCDHAKDPLRAMLEAAVNCGYHTFGVTEHAPRTEPQYLYEEEIQLGWDEGTIEALFCDYAMELDSLREEFADRLCVLKGFEAEIVPPVTYPVIMNQFKRNLKFDYIVGSVHYVDGIIIDYTAALFNRALEHCGGYEELAVRYYRAVAEMVLQLKPEVVGHFDLVKKGLPDRDINASPRIRKAAAEALEVIRENKAILDINTAGYRKGLGAPFPDPEYIRMACEMGIPMCFGDDSHSVEQVGMDVDKSRECLLRQGVTSIVTLVRSGSGLERKEVPLRAC